VIAYTMVGTTDLVRAIGFYDALFDQMGLESCWRDDQSASWGKKDDLAYPRFFTGYPFDGEQGSVGNGVMTAFLIDTPDAIDQLHRIALSNGGCDEGAPALRPQYGEGFYAAYARDPDGNKLAFVNYGGV
jgi:predicted enzyme related to lactoylglutathione lyase